MPKHLPKHPTLKPAPPVLPTPGAQIRAARQRANLTQEQLGERLGISKQSIADLEAWKDGPGRRRSFEWFIDPSRIDVWTELGLGLELYAAAQQSSLSVCPCCQRPFEFEAK